ncbi:hypothetical protein [Kosakonia sp. S42]|nr:hypothetical protein [Kosakonia sp. S42]MBK0018995.1 hypothetical protein [Kosakonia sp. S42]
MSYQVFNKLTGVDQSKIINNKRFGAVYGWREKIGRAVSGRQTFTQ